MQTPRVLVLYAAHPDVTLSYHTGWPRHFLRHPGFRCTGVNLHERSRLPWLLRKSLLSHVRYDAIVLLHTVFSNTCYLRGRLFELVAQLNCPKAYFIGNEYKLMPEKMRFCDELGVGLLVTMNPCERAGEMYRQRLGSQVVCIPSAGLDTEVFFPRTEPEERRIDLGYRSFETALYLGHTERRDIASFFQRNAGRRQLTVDISLKPEDRYTSADWATFLNRCRGQLGTEAGTDYFELTDELRLKVNDYVTAHPEATMDEVHHLYFRNYADPVSVRTISGRNVEAAATKTVQILFRGRYSDYLQPDVHYIPLEKDFSNFDEAMDKFGDRAFCRELAENAYQVAIERLTYEKLIDGFAQALRPLL